MAEQTPLEKVRESYGRCVLSDTFFEDFYENFMGSSSEIRSYFSKTDVVKQKEILREGISFMILYAAQNAAGKLALQRIGKIHDQKHANVRPDLYPLWVENLIKTVEKHDKHFDAQVRSAWESVLSQGIDYFKSVYIPKEESE